MSSRLQPYSLYKPSGVPWLGDVPVYWDVPSLKHVCLRYALYGANVSATKYLQSGIRFLRTSDITDTGNLNEDGVFLPEVTVRDYMLNDGDILLSRSGTVGRSFLYQSNLHGPCSYAGYLVRFIPGERVIPKYIFFFTKTASFEGFLRSVAVSSTIENVNANKYSAAKLPLPPLSEQKSIVIHLSKITYRIDSLIEKLQRKIELLKEHRTALISQCVTKGLNPNVEMKDSGVEWIGEIPIDWNTSPLKYVVSSNDEVLSDNTNPGYEFRYIEISDVNQFSGIGPGKKVSFSTSPSRARRILRENDVLISTVRTYLRAIGTVRNCRGNLIGSTGFCVLRATQSILPSYLSYLVNSEQFVASVVSNSVGVSYPAINSSDLVNLKSALPSLHEQTQISQYLDKKTSQIDSLFEKLQRKIEFLKEYRHSLISNVVTGKVKVTEDTP